MLEYGQSYLEQNDVAIAYLESGMSPAAIAFAKEMAADLDDDDSETN